MSNIVTRIDIFTQAYNSSTDLTTLQTAVNTAISALSGETCFGAILSCKPRRSAVDLVVTLQIAATAKNVRAISSINLYASNVIATLEGLITTKTGVAPTAPSNYGDAQIITCSHRDAKLFVALLPTMTKMGGSWVKVTEVNNTGSATHSYTVLPTDEIINLTTDAHAEAILLPTVATSSGREIIFIGKALTAAVTLTANGVETIISGSGVSATTLVMSATNDIVVLACNGTKWFAREIQTQNHLRAVTAVTDVAGAGLAYAILAADEIINFTTTGGGNITTTLPAVASSAGRKLTFIYLVDGGTGVIEISPAAVNNLLKTDGTASTKCTLPAGISKIDFECDGTKWHAMNLSTGANAPTFA